jgi:GNAT superfamily N-acetyltransferase
VIGSIEYGPVSQLIIDLTNGELKELVEVGTVYVHPDYQGTGIGTLLLNVMFLTLKNKGIEDFCLDSGYKRAQKIWTKKFGEPDYLKKDYWSPGFHHMIWKRILSEMTIKFKI